jgi:nicotinate-nucleotide adenylyltransferase
MKSIALFGGSFDPPHFGHKAVVDAALSALDIEAVIVMPTYLNPFKSQVYASSELRLRWLKMIFSNYKKVKIDEYEIRCKQKVPTLQTVRHLLQSYEKIYLIIGADNLEKLHLWHGYNELEKLVTFVVASREEIPLPKEILALHIEQNVSSTALRMGEKKEFLPECVAEEIEKFYKENN